MDEEEVPYPTALTVAGSDSGGGAGVQADLKTFVDHGVFGMSVITAITAQNSLGVHRVDLVPVEGVLAQLDAVFSDFPVGAVKIGMLGTAAHVRAVAAFLRTRSPAPPVVLDPVMVASTGHRLLDADAERAIVNELLPLAAVATPNRDEGIALASVSGVDARDDEAIRTWALRAPCPILVTGGDTTAREVTDVLVANGQVRRWVHPRLGDRPFHGTGCTLASAIAARMADGDPLEEAVDGAIAYVAGLIRRASVVGSVGLGNPSLPHGIR